MPDVCRADSLFPFCDLMVSVVSLLWLDGLVVSREWLAWFLSSACVHYRVRSFSLTHIFQNFGLFGEKRCWRCISDIDECTSGRSLCRRSETCVNTVGSYRCLVATSTTTTSPPPSEMRQSSDFTTWTTSTTMTSYRTPRNKPSRTAASVLDDLEPARTTRHRSSTHQSTPHPTFWYGTRMTRTPSSSSSTSRDNGDDVRSRGCPNGFARNAVTGLCEGKWVLSRRN